MPRQPKPKKPAKKTPEKKPAMIGYKGFDKDLKCRGLQYAVGETVKEDVADLCNRGLHFCEDPFDIFGYYPPADDNGFLNRFAEIEAEDVSEKTSDDSKRVCAKLKVKTELGLAGLVKAKLDFIFSKITSEKTESNTGDRSAATNTGYWSAATNTGYRSTAKAEGKESFAIVTGLEGKAAGALGCWIACAEWERVDDGWHIKDFQTARVDGKKIKPGVFYVLRDGQFVEAEGQ